jgi:hypothetical protein
MTAAAPDTDSERNPFREWPAFHSESLGFPSLPSLSDNYNLYRHDPYPSWSAERQIPMSIEEIEDIFLDLTQKFGFQRDSMRNMVRSAFSIYIKLNPFHTLWFNCFPTAVENLILRPSYG